MSHISVNETTHNDIKCSLRRRQEVLLAGPSMLTWYGGSMGTETLAGGGVCEIPPNWNWPSEPPTG